MNEMMNLINGSSETLVSRRKAVLITAGCAAATALGGTLARAQSMSGVSEMTGGKSTAMTGSDDYATKTLMIGGLALETSKIAREKASNPSVKQFAGLEMTEQEAIAAVLKANGATPPPMSDAMQQKLSALAAMTGKDFDMKYLEIQIEGHQKLLAVQQTKLDGSPTEPQVIVAKLSTPAIETHLVMLNMIKGMV